MDMIYAVIASGLFESTHPHDVNEIPCNFSVTAILISIYISKVSNTRVSGVLCIDVCIIMLAILLAYIYTEE